MRYFLRIGGLILILGISEFLQAQSVTITEINYNSDSTLNTGDWIELHNLTNAPVNLSGWKLRDGNPLHLFIVPNGITIPAGGYHVFCSDTQRFDSFYSLANRTGDLGFGLSNKGDTIQLYSNTNVLQFDLAFTDTLPWPLGADGYGRTLHLKSPGLDIYDTLSWGTGCIGGSPGMAFSPCVNETLVVSEVNYKSLTTENAGDWFEIHNLTAQSMDVSGYLVRDSKNTNAFVIPNGTIIPAKGYLVFYNTPVLFNTQHPGIFNKVGPVLFNLDGVGEAIRIYNAQDKIIFSVFYDDSREWPNDPDGFGYTLEADTNFDFSRDVNWGDNWFSGCMEGTPGRGFDDDCFVGTEENLTTEIHVFPNPSLDGFQVSGLSYLPVQLTVTDLTGKTVYSNHVYSSGQHVQPDIPGGYYTIQFFQGTTLISIQPWVKLD